MPMTVIVERVLSPGLRSGTERPQSAGRAHPPCSRRRSRAPWRGLDGGTGCRRGPLGARRDVHSRHPCDEFDEIVGERVDRSLRQDHDVRRPGLDVTGARSPSEPQVTRPSPGRDTRSQR